MSKTDSDGMFEANQSFSESKLESEEDTGLEERDWRLGGDSFAWWDLEYPITWWSASLGYLEIEPLLLSPLVRSESIER